MMEAALLAAVLADPDDDLPRLAYADWLEEHDQPERAEFIRVQMELASPRPWTQGHTLCHHEPPCKRCCRCPACLLRDREQALSWITNHSDYVFGADVVVNDWTFRRGWIESVTCAATDWLAHADVITARHPVQEVVLTTMPEVHSQVRYKDGKCNWVTWIGDRGPIEEGADFGSPIGMLSSEWVKQVLAAYWPRITFALPPPLTAEDIVRMRDRIEASYRGDAVSMREWLYGPSPVDPRFLIRGPL